MFSIIIKQIALSYLQTTIYPSCVTVMAYPLGQIGMRPESSPTLNKRTITKRKGVFKWNRNFFVPRKWHRS